MRRAQKLEPGALWSGGADCSIKLWDAADAPQESTATLTAHSNTVTHLLYNGSYPPDFYALQSSRAWNIKPNNMFTGRPLQPAQVRQVAVGLAEAGDARVGVGVAGQRIDRLHLLDGGDVGAEVRRRRQRARVARGRRRAGASGHLLRAMRRIGIAPTMASLAKRDPTIEVIDLRKPEPGNQPVRESK